MSDAILVKSLGVEQWLREEVQGKEDQTSMLGTDSSKVSSRKVPRSEALKTLKICFRHQLDAKLAMFGCKAREQRLSVAVDSSLV